MKKILQIVCVVIVAVGTHALLSADDSPQHQRWAIIASEDVGNSGLPGLLTAKLSAEENLELVERDELLAATRELELSILYGSQAAGKRLELGKVLQADALVLLSLNKQQEKTYLKVIIADCLTGARLHTEYVPYESSEPERASKICSAIILKTQQRFANGVQKLIGITPFLSKNLTHEHDNLQTALPALISSSLSEYPGIAVLELEEAKSIAHELSLTGGELKYKFMMLFVDGEYKVIAGSEEQPISMRLVVRIDDGKKIQPTIDQENLSLDEATELLMQQAAKKIAGLADSERIQPLNRALQYDQLAARAKTFSDVGSWSEATSLREAALLLNPDFEQRLALIADYRRQQFHDHQAQAQAMSRFIGENSQVMSPELVEKHWGNIYWERLSRLRLVALHTALVIRSGNLNPYEADLLAAACYRDPLHLKLSGENVRQDYRDALYHFFWDIYPLFPQLDAAQNGGKIRLQVARVDPYRRPRSSLVGIGEPNPRIDKTKLERSQREAWTYQAIGFLTLVAPLKTELGKSLNIAPNTWDDRRTLDEFYRFLNDVVPGDETVFVMSTITMKEKAFSASTFLEMVRQKRFTLEEMLKFCERLERCTGRANQLYGRCGKLALNIRATNKSLDESVVQEADALLKSIVDQRKKTGNDQYAAGYDEAIAELREYAVDQLSEPRKKRHELTPNIIPPVDPAPPVTFTPVAGFVPEWDHIIKCSDSLDIMWSRRSAFSMSAPGKVIELFTVTEKRDQISSVVWDGKNVWIGALTSGIHIFSPDGKLLSKVGTNQGLPPYDDSAKQEGFSRSPKRALLLHPNGPGNCIAIGRFGERNRVWCAVISQQKPGGESLTFQARVFHSATKIGDKSEGVDAIFNLNSLAEIPDRNDPNDPKRGLLLVGRGIPDGWPLTMRPLSIDLATLKTTVFPGLIETPLHATLDGRIAFHASLSKISCYSAPTQEDGDWSLRTLAYYGAMSGEQTSDRGAVDDHHHFVPQLFAYQGKLYNPGIFWQCIDPDSASIERLNEVALPLRYRYQHYGVSAHYGMIGWNNYDRYYRASIDQPQKTEVNLAELYPEVPADLRKKHHQAILEIRKLGGYVDASWGVAAWGMAFPDKGAHWFTRVHLPKTWNGGDKGLSHLQDLHNLRSLMLVQANASDEGMKDFIGKLQDLRALQLVETDVTNEGLVHLQSLKHLTHVRLEGTVGGNQFGDEGMKFLAHVPWLNHLEIYGPGFTADGLRWINEVRHPFVQLIDTKVTNTELLALRKTISGLRASINE